MATGAFVFVSGNLFSRRLATSNRSSVSSNLEPGLCEPGPMPCDGVFDAAMWPFFLTYTFLSLRCEILLEGKKARLLMVVN